MTDAPCDVCGGDGHYPIIDVRGTERYLIRCPECQGTGKAPMPVVTEVIDWPINWPPASTAAKVRSVEELRDAVKAWNGDD